MTSVSTTGRFNFLYACLVAVALLGAGCVERTIKITSEPPGALVYLNDQEVGRTPCETDFLYYGTYDVRLVLDGYGPYMGPGDADMPLYQIPPIDLLAEITPVPFRDVVEWHFDLKPVDTTREAIVERARQLRSTLNPQTADGPPTEPTEESVSDEATPPTNQPDGG